MIKVLITCVQEETYLKQFKLTWQLHNKHLFHSVIYSDPVVQNCMPKVLSCIRFKYILCLSVKGPNSYIPPLTGKP